MSLESELISWLEQNLPKDTRLEIGLGDDAAVIAARSRAAVVTTDMLTDEVDFLIEEVDPQLVGQKALGVNLSDLAAMAAQPIAAFVSLVLPKEGTSKRSALELAIEIYRGMIPLAERHRITIAGGDTNTWAGPLGISITAIGETTTHGPLTRSGAQAGDQILVTGHLGGSILGKHLNVEPRVSEALLLHDRYEIHAGIDVSDGLAIDASRLAKASGMGACLNLSSIPIAAAAEELSKKTGRPAIEHALGDGEDFELVLAVPPAAAKQLLDEQPLDVPLTGIGEIVPKRGLWQSDEAGNKTPLQVQGFEHQGTV